MRQMEMSFKDTSMTYIFSFYSFARGNPLFFEAGDAPGRVHCFHTGTLTGIHGQNQSASTAAR